ncbi:hypothetical protein [Haloarchaeobius sp. DYHT-AS-18]|uniref:hypothetical protein n=1 Tax=Haloarchaeobius sp. DYHT-AS-18 TaxID=3446117 RepID=UPI003EBB6961
MRTEAAPDESNARERCRGRGHETGRLSGSTAMVVRLDSTGRKEFARRYPPGDEQTDRYCDRSRT